MAATFLEQLLKGAQIHSRPFGNNIVRARFGRMDLKRSRAGHLASYRCDRNQRVVTSTHVGVVCDELLIDHDGVEFDSQPGISHTIYRKNRLTDLSWDTLLTVVGDGSRKQVTNSLVAPLGFYRINSE